MRDRMKSKDLLNAFRESRHQVEQRPVEKSVNNVDKREKTFSRGYTHKKPSDPYSRFLDKYSHLADTIDDFKTQDFMYFFREKAQESGIKYVIANTKRDMAIFKRLQDNYSAREICLMIEFLFCSNQNYLDKTRTQPTVLTSTWCNTIYRDALLWVNDEYSPVEKNVSTKKDRLKKREWHKSIPEEDEVKIGGWDD